ncbi:MAG: flagellar type III secretion system pore protein FliP [Planctomycetota bacterium]
MCLVALMYALAMLGTAAWGQDSAGGVPAPGADAGDAAVSGPQGTALDPFNPISILENADRALPLNSGTDSNPSATNGVGGSSGGSVDGGLSASLSIILLLTVLSLAPAILVMCTSFTRIIVVLALLRQAVGTQSLPPSQVLVGLSLFMTVLIMMPTFERINNEALQPLQAGQIDQIEAWERTKQPLRDFMFDQIDYADNWDTVYMFMEYRGQDTSNPAELRRKDVDMITLVPSFILSELEVAFLMGFRLYLPFLVIDMVISSVLISMGMMMLPPIFISLPFKLLLFVLVDGWRLVAGGLLNSFAVPGVTT